MVYEEKNTAYGVLSNLEKIQNRMPVIPSKIESLDDMQRRKSDGRHYSML